ncbi:heavy metal-associated isoprenylated plant protein 47-like [Cornus florida]|uniref:heavy metal-associated isoprenylated plant protein 47-like n=1 Tax=Cornus florida TaxID=4283 RepID=UPI00289F0BD9|nr:heavy metal-associated isoprenylated plant protein 47-like [Cornus florida]
MKQKIVIQMHLTCEKCRSKAMKVASVAYGVSSVAIEGEDKSQVVVVGDGVDAVKLTSSLRKKVGCASLISVEKVKPKVDTGKDKVTIVPCQTSCYQNPQVYVCESVSDQYSSGCSIM